MKRVLTLLAAAFLASSQPVLADSQLQTLGQSTWTDLGTGPLIVQVPPGQPSVALATGSVAPAQATAPSFYAQPGQPLQSVQTSLHVYARSLSGSSSIVFDSAAASSGGGPATQATTPWVEQQNVSAGAGGVSNFARLASSAATTNATLVKGSAGRVYKMYGCNTTTSPVYIHLTNAAAAPTPGTTPVYRVRVFPGSGTAGAPLCQSFDDADLGASFSAGVGFWLSTGPADTDATAVAAGAVTLLEVAFQ